MTKSADEAYAELKKTFTPDKIRPAVVLNLDDPEDLALVNGSLKWAPGLVPGEPNEGLVAGKFIEAPPRLADFDDSSWETPANIRDVVGTGFTFAWYRLKFTIPTEVNGESVEGQRLLFETNIDNYAEIWIDGAIDRLIGAILGINAQHRVDVTAKSVPGTQHTIACLVANGPLGEPRGGIYMRFATLAWESPN
jgi:hypothetical protein